MSRLQIVTDMKRGIHEPVRVSVKTRTERRNIRLADAPHPLDVCCAFTLSSETEVPGTHASMAPGTVLFLRLTLSPLIIHIRLGYSKLNFICLRLCCCDDVFYPNNMHCSSLQMLLVSK